MSKDMKLIMERFRKNLNEMPAGLGMGLKVGAATAAGKADAARKAAEDKKEEERQAMAAANFQFTYKLQGLGREPQYIEIEPGDIKGVDYNHFVDYLNEQIYPPARKIPFGKRFFFTDGKIVLFHTDDYQKIEPAKISGEELSGILRTALEPRGLWMQLYTRRTDGLN